MSDLPRDRAFEELLRSPLEDEPGRRPGAWLQLAVGALIGGAGVLLIASVFVGGPIASAPTTLAPLPTTTSAQEGVIDPDARYPPGFREVSEGVALGPLGAVQVDDVLFVSIGTAIARGTEEPARRFHGGRWELEIRNGTRLPVAATIHETLVPTAFSLRFDAPADAGAQALHLIEQWELDSREVSVDIDVSSFPFTLESPTSVDLGDGVLLRIDALDLDVTGGGLTWSVDGVDALAAPALIGFTILDEDGDAVDNGYSQRDAFFGGAFINDESFLKGAPSSGRATFVRASREPLSGATIRVFGSVPLIRATPADVVLDVSVLPIVTR